MNAAEIAPISIGDLDFEPETPCEARIHGEDHAHPADWSLMLTCGHGALLCTAAKDRCVSMVLLDVGYCPECRSTTSVIAHILPIHGGDS